MPKSKPKVIKTNKVQEQNPISPTSPNESQRGPLHVTEEDPLTRLQRHYLWGVQDMDTRRVRKNGWNEVINAYMGKLPVNWPYNSVVTNPLIRTTILEKTSRLLNAKLQGRLVPREGGDVIKAKISNALLDFQWDIANEGGSMIEKTARADQYSRIFGNSWALVYWDTKKEANDIKLIDPRDIFYDGASTHVKNAKWIQVREFTTFDKLEDRGYDVKEARKMAESGEITAELRSTRYESITKANRGLVDRTGMIDDLKNPVVEVVTEWGYNRFGEPYQQIFLPKYSMFVIEKAGKDYPYKHGRLPVAMLRYYPLDDDIYGESEVESVLPLYRGMNALICGLIDECNIKIRPPLKISSSGVRIETIEYGPGAKWIMNNPNNVMELEPSGGFATAFNTVYPMLLAAYNTAMGDNSLGVSNLPPFTEKKTATEVVASEKQQTSRDQYNQLYLGEFLKDIMEMWQANNKQFLFDDPTKKYYILKVVGKDMIQEFQQLQLDQMDVPDYAMNQIANTIGQNPSVVTDAMLQDIMKDVAVPTNPVIENPNERPEKFKIHNKLEINEKNKNEADLYIQATDFEGLYDYIPDVKSMAAGAGIMQQQSRQKVYDLVFGNPLITQLLAQQGQQLKTKELLINMFEDAGEKDAEGLFEQPQPQNQPMMQGGMPNGQPGQPVPGQPNPIGPSGMPNQPNGGQGMAGIPQAVPAQPSPRGLPRPASIPGQ